MKRNIFLCFISLLFISCGDSGSSNNKEKRVEGISYDKIFSKKTLKNSKDYANINKNEILNGFLEFPEEEYLQSIQEIRQYLENRYNLTLNQTPSIKKSLYFTSYKFRQNDSKALKCGSSINITLDNENKVFKTYIFKIDDFDTCKRAENYFENQRKFTIKKAPSLNDGNIEKTMIKVFKPDPITVSKGTFNLSNDIEQLEIPDNLYSYEEIEALKKDNKYYFKNKRVEAIDLIAKQSTSKGKEEKQDILQGIYKVDNFKADFKKKEFLEQMAFYHLNDSLKYLEKLGYKNEFSIFDETLKFDAQVYANDKSAYFPDIKILTYGTGRTADALDADVIRHELGHAINYNMASDFDGGDTGAMGEGFADYWAAYYSLYLQKDDEKKFEINKVFNFDGFFGLKRKLNNYDAKYNIFSEYRAHISVNGESADELWSTPLFSSLKDSIELYSEIAYDEINKILIESFSGIGYGIKMFQMAENIVKTAKKIYPNKKYYEIFLKNFKFHNIFQNKIEFYTDKKFVNKKDEITLFYKNTYFENTRNLNFKILSKNLNFDNKFFENIQLKQNESNFEKIQLNVKESINCSENIDISIGSKFNLNNQREESIENHINLIYGKPYFENMPNIIDKTLTFASNSFLINEEKDSLIDDNFAFILELSSQNLSEIKVILKTPWGEELNLLRDLDLSQNNLKKVYVLKNEKIFEQLKNKNKKGTWFLKITNTNKNNKTVLYRYAITKIKNYLCK